jgi:Asp-tRNA(Asn)/Glu-tRNA(Gln) amidotransferase B subunit
VRTGHSNYRFHYWTCGLRQRQDSAKCHSSVYLNEETLVQSIQQGMSTVFDDEAAIIDEAIARASAMASAHEYRVTEVNKQIAACEAELNRLATRLVDGDLSDPAVKRLLSSKVGEKTDELDRLVGLRKEISSEQDSEKSIAAAVRQTFDQAKQAISSITTDSEFNQFVHDFVGPITVYPGGKIEPAKSIVLSAGAQSAQSDCAPADRNEVIRAAFWRKLEHSHTLGLNTK